MVSSLSCPNCKAEVSSIIGHKNPHVFDGVLYWSCGVCLFAWPREHAYRLRQIAAENAAELHNDIRERAMTTLGAPDGTPQADDRGE